MGILVGTAVTALLAKQIGGKIGFPIVFHPAMVGTIGLAINFLIAMAISIAVKPKRNEEFVKILSQ